MTFLIGARAILAPSPAGPRPSLGEAVLPTAPVFTPIPTAPPSPSVSASPSASPSATASASPTPEPTKTPIPKPSIPARGPAIWGRVTAADGKPIGGACVTLGPPIACWTYTSRTGNADDDGYYLVDLGKLQTPPGQSWEIYVVVKSYTAYSYDNWYSGVFKVSDVVRKDAQLH